jgi:hypothetical protein
MVWTSLTPRVQPPSTRRLLHEHGNEQHEHGHEYEHFTLAGVAWRLDVLSASKDIKKPSFAHSPVAGPGVCNGYYFIYVSPPGPVLTSRKGGYELRFVIHPQNCLGKEAWKGRRALGNHFHSPI